MTGKYTGVIFIGAGILLGIIASYGTNSTELEPTESLQQEASEPSYVPRLITRPPRNHKSPVIYPQNGEGMVPACIRVRKKATNGGSITRKSLKTT